MESVSFSAKAEKQKVTREQALRVARQLGCRGAHQHDDGSWMPCNSHDEFVAIRKSKNEYYKISAQQRFEVGSEIEHRVKRLESKSNAYYENRADAEAVSKIRGCGGVRVVMLAGKKYYTICDHKAPKNGWENLDESPIVGIDTLPDGGLVSTPISGKGFVNFVSRSTDPDTFSNPDSARVRARNLGCIGIRRYTASDGKLVWLPCSNVSDYNRVTGIRGDNSPRNNPRRQGSGFKKKVLGTPIGGTSNEDGDGDGFTTRGIPGAPDNIPVTPKPKNPLPEPFTGLKPYSDYFKKSSKLKKDFEKHIQERMKKGESREMISFRIGLFNRNKPQYVDHWSKLRPKLFDFYFQKFRSGMGYAALDILRHPDVPRGPGRPRKKGISEGIISLKTALRPKRKNPTIDSDTINMLAIKVRQHNANVSKPSYKTNLRDIKVVYLRGLSMGDEKTALKRVNNFLRAMASDTPLPKGERQDFDIVPETHPSKDKKTAKKDGSFDDGEFGIKYKSACCPQLVKRHKKL